MRVDDRQRHGAAARTDVEQARRAPATHDDTGRRLIGHGLGHLAQLLEGHFDQGLGLGPRDQRVLVDPDLDLVKGLATDQVGNRLMTGATGDELVKERVLGCAEHALRFGVEAFAGDTQHVGEQNFDVEARRLRASSQSPRLDRQRALYGPRPRGFGHACAACRRSIA